MQAAPSTSTSWSDWSSRPNDQKWVFLKCFSQKFMFQKVDVFSKVFLSKVFIKNVGFWKCASTSWSVWSSRPNDRKWISKMAPIQRLRFPRVCCITLPFVDCLSFHLLPEKVSASMEVAAIPIWGHWDVLMQEKNTLLISWIGFYWF